jgi:hypothetical protein
MHRSPFACAKAVLPAIDLTHHPVHVTSFSQAMTVATMSTGQFVTVVKVHADPGGDGLLACVKMNKPRNLASRELHVNPFLKFSDGPHCPVSLQ